MKKIFTIFLSFFMMVSHAQEKSLNEHIFYKSLGFTYSGSSEKKLKIKMLEYVYSEDTKSKNKIKTFTSKNECLKAIDSDFDDIYSLIKSIKIGLDNGVKDSTGLIYMNYLVGKRGLFGTESKYLNHRKDYYVVRYICLPRDLIVPLDLAGEDVVINGSTPDSNPYKNFRFDRKKFFEWLSPYGVKETLDISKKDWDKKLYIFPLDQSDE